MRDTHLFGLILKNISLRDCVANIILSAQEKTKEQIYFINAHCINIATCDADYLHALENATLLFADGIGMRLASSLAGDRLCDNVNGTDLFPLLCEQAANTGITLGLLGARQGVAERCANRMCQLYPGLNIVWTHDGYLDQNNSSEILGEINSVTPDILLVAMGVPKQELWIMRNAPFLHSPVLMGVGALFDFYSGDMPRAPKLLRRLGFEWLYRFLQEPRRLFKRYIIGNPIFLARCIAYRLQGQDSIRHKRLE